MPLLQKYDLHLFELCRTAQDLSKELATKWLSRYMLGSAEDDPRIAGLVDFFTDYKLHKSHSRGINRTRARELLGERVVYVEEIEGLGGLVRSLANQYELWFDKLPFYKMFEDARGVHWGRQAQTITLQLPIGLPGIPQPQPAPQPGPPIPSA